MVVVYKEDVLGAEDAETYRGAESEVMLVDDEDVPVAGE